MKKFIIIIILGFITGCGKFTTITYAEKIIEDTNCNGVYDVDDIPMPMVEITFSSENAQREIVTYTDIHGIYSISGIKLTERFMIEYTSLEEETLYRLSPDLILVGCTI